MKVRSALVGALAVLTLAACGSSGGASKPSELNDQTSSGPYAGVGLTPPYPRPTFTLTDTAGKTYSFGAQTAGRATLLYFGYTHCPDICPATFADLGNALRALPKAVQSKVTVVFVSTDVKRDTGPVIARWLANFSPGTSATFVGLRGSQAQVDAAQAAAHVVVAEDSGATHSTQVLLYGPDNYARVSFVYNNSQEQKQMEHDIPLVVNEGS